MYDVCLDCENIRLAIRQFAYIECSYEETTKLRSHSLHRALSSHDSHLTKDRDGIVCSHLSYVYGALPMYKYNHDIDVYSLPDSYLCGLANHNLVDTIPLCSRVYQTNALSSLE